MSTGNKGRAPVLWSAAEMMRGLAEKVERLRADQREGQLDLGCVASVGTFGRGGADSMTFTLDKRAAGSFLLELMARLQGCGTAPAIDYRAYAKWMKAGNGTVRKKGIQPKRQRG